MAEYTLAMTKKTPTKFCRFSTALLAISFGAMPLLSSVHLAMVPHVYSVEHRHYHEIVTVFENGRSADWPGRGMQPPAGPAGQLRGWSPEIFVEQVECPLANQTLRDEMLQAAGVHLPGDTPAGDRLVVCRKHRGFYPPVLWLAPKHSPPLSLA